MNSSRNLVSWTFALGFALAMSACGQRSKPRFIYMPDMYWSPALKAQEAGMRMPAPGTMPQGYEPMRAETLEEAGRSLKNPLLKTTAVLERGARMFNTYCIACHGPYGEGDGTIVPKFPRPPSLQSEKVRTYADGSIYYVITRGQNLMPQYASQIAQNDRWAIIHYIRALQRAKNPSEADLKAADSE